MEESSLNVVERKEMVSSSTSGPSCKPFFHNYTHVPGSREELLFESHFSQMTHFNQTISQFSAELILFFPTSSSHSNMPRSQVKCH